MIKNEYVKEFYHSLTVKYPNEQEYLNACLEILKTIEDEVTEIDVKENVLERIFLPDRIITFKVVYEGDDGQIKVNTGYRIQQNNALGPYKGGLRFSHTVTPSILKFLSTEQVFKNALTGLPLGGGKGGSDFDPKGKSDREINRFCKAFMSELIKYVGPEIDVPAGDLGVGAREISYMYGEYKRLSKRFDGVLTGKDPIFGGSLIRKEATGYGLVYFVVEMLKTYYNTDLVDKKIVVSGSGNVSIYAAEKVIQSGGKVIAMSDSSGYVYNENGLNLEWIKQIKEVDRKRINTYLEYDESAIFTEGASGIFSIKCEICLPCATQNEITINEAKELIKNSCKIVAEGANMPCTIEAFEYLMANGCIFAPGKAANAGGVSVSGLEMSQNASHIYWSAEKVDQELRNIMQNIFYSAYEYGKKNNNPTDLLSAVNRLSYRRVADAVIKQGI